MYQGIHSEIINRCRLGDRKAQRELFELYARPMLNVAVRIVDNREEAEDILQESFLEMFKNINGFRAESSFGSWFKRIVINRSLNQLRKKKTLVYDYEFEDEADVEQGNETWPDLSVSDIEQALEKLPDGYKVVFKLFMFDNLSHQEIAEFLGISESTSKSQFFKARKKLRSQLLTN